MTLPVLTAVPGAWEAPLVSGLERSRTEVVVVRRCVDLADLLSAAASGQARAVLLSADLRRLDRDALERLAAARVAVVGLTDPTDAAEDGGTGASERRLRLLGVRYLVAADAPPHDVAEVVAAAVADLEEAPAPTGVADPASALDAAAAAAAPWPSSSPDPDGTAPDDGPGGPASGQVVAVWGPVGAPGRTTVAVTLAAELAAAGESALLADADTYGACVAQVLGLLDEAPGLAAACRAASAGTLEPATLARLAPAASPGLRVLTGISRSARWPELSSAALEEVLRVARSVARWTVVDCGALLEADEELSFDTAAPRRNAATLTALEVADVVLAVGAADPVGLQRLVRGLQELADVVPTATPRVVVTRVRASAVGSSPQQRVADALARYAGVSDVVLVPDDRPACDAALLAGRTLTEAAPGSSARLALAGLAGQLTGRSAEPRARGRRRSARLRA